MKSNEVKKSAKNHSTKVTVADKKAIAQANVAAAKNAIIKHRKQVSNQ